MKNYYLLGAMVSVMIVAGCSSFRVTPALCDTINTEAGDIPQECQAYSHEKAKKAFDKVKDKDVITNEDIVEFHKEEK
jgi:predicted house-cleaning NTP pyrophosphatase (Maf/HAM1 superfamily)